MERPFGRRTVVADNVVDERVFEDAQLFQTVQHAADMVVGEFHEPCVDLCFATKKRLEIFRHLVPRRYLGVARRERAISRNDPQLLLAGKSFLAELVPTLIELAFVLVGPLLRHMVC